MTLLQNKLSLKVTQKQILTPGLVQMVTVLALNKLELKDMITAEMVENPVLDELEDHVPSIEEMAGKEKERDRVETAGEENLAPEEKSDPFDEIDFGSFFRDYLDPGHRTLSDHESLERPSFENFLSKPATLTDHLMWQLGSITTSDEVHEAAERIIGNLNEDGYLLANEGELLGLTDADPEPEPATPGPRLVEDTKDIESGLTAGLQDDSKTVDVAMLSDEEDGLAPQNPLQLIKAEKPESETDPLLPRPRKTPRLAPISSQALQEAMAIVHAMDPPGVAARDLRECLLLQLQHLKSTQERLKQQNTEVNGNGHDWNAAIAIVDSHLKALQNKQYKEIARAIGCVVEEVLQAYELIKTLDPKPGARYNLALTRLIEPDVAFVKHSDQWLVMMNEDDLPQLRLNPTYKRLMMKNAAEKDVRNYVKERYKSAMQLIKNIEQRKQTIMRVCHSIIERQSDFLELGIDQLKPMMIKEVAEEIGVHPSTVSRAVSNKYCHTPQGVFELRYFFSESVNGPEGSGTSLLILKRRVKKLIDEEDQAHPYTDEKIAKVLQTQGIQVTRRTVAKYREDMRIPSTHLRRRKD